MLLNQAIAARVPMISVQMDDRVYANDVLEFITGKKFEPWESAAEQGPKKDTFYFKISSKGTGPANPIESYRELLKMGSTLVYSGLKAVPPEFFDAGQVSPPVTMFKKHLSAAIDASKLDPICQAIAGLSYLHAINCMRITAGRDKVLSPSGLMTTRREMMKMSRGVTFVDPYLSAYHPMEMLQKFALEEGPYFLKGTDPRLRARGLLFDGDPGTGKTQGAKFIASTWKVPLLRLDATFQEKWVGNSEEHFSQALKMAEECAPCVLLIDEVEKFFSGSKSESTGIMAKVMSLLLWFLQEHKSRILTVMTTNDRSIIPPELYRDGRIDGVFKFAKLYNKDAVQQVAQVIWNSFVDGIVPDMLVEHIVKDAGGWQKGVSHAHVASAVKQAVKKTQMAMIAEAPVEGEQEVSNG